MKMNDFSLSEALEYVQALRPQVKPNAAFMAQLGKYEIELRTSRAVRDGREDSKDNPNLPYSVSVAERPDQGPVIRSPDSDAVPGEGLGVFVFNIIRTDCFFSTIGISISFTGTSEPKYESASYEKESTNEDGEHLAKKRRL